MSKSARANGVWGVAGCVLSLGMALGAPAPAAAAPVELAGSYRVDVIGAVSGDAPHRGRVLHDVTIDADADLAELAGWHGARAHATVLGDFGGTPNDDIATLQGVDNIEVSRHRVRLFEAWLEQDLGHGAGLRAGLYDLNAEFYANDSAGLLLAPAFGIGSELAATGPNGPSIFPSTSLAVRLRLQPSANTYVQAAALNAHAGVLGDPDGIDTSFDDGALVIGEFGWTGPIKIGVGGWTYSKRQDDIRDVGAAGAPERRRAAGAYLLLERELWAQEESGRKVTGFLRAGLADGDTTPFRGGWQAGVLVAAPIASRPNSQFSIGVNQARLSDKFRANFSDAGGRASASEGQLEITYADTLGRLTLQPDVQYVVRPGGDAARRDVVIAGLRLGVEF
jgi:porin